MRRRCRGQVNGQRENSPARLEIFLQPLHQATLLRIVRVSEKEINPTTLGLIEACIRNGCIKRVQTAVDVCNTRDPKSSCTGLGLRDGTEAVALTGNC